MKNLIELIEKFEGLRLKAYRCPAGVWTIGYGATGPGIAEGLVWTRQQAEDRLAEDAPAYLRATRKMMPELSGNQLEAVADLCYNIGAAHLAGSTLKKMVSAGDMEGAAGQFSRWVFGGGKRLPGLVARREAERLLFISK